MPIVRYEFELDDIQSVIVKNYTYKTSYTVVLRFKKGRKRTFNMEISMPQIDTFIADLKDTGMEVDIEKVEPFANWF